MSFVASGAHAVHMLVRYIDIDAQERVVLGTRHTFANPRAPLTLCVWGGPHKPAKVHKFTEALSILQRQLGTASWPVSSG